MHTLSVLGLLASLSERDVTKERNRNRICDPHGGEEAARKVFSSDVGSVTASVYGAAFRRYGKRLLEKGEVRARALGSWALGNVPSMAYPLCN